MAQPAAFFLQFLPEGYREGYVPKNPDNTSTDPVDYEGTATVQQAAALCTFGKSLLESIERDYDAAMKDWKIKSSICVSALAKAIAAKNKVMAADKEEHDREAARAALIFNLLTGATLRLVGAYVQYVAAPRIDFSGAYGFLDGKPWLGISEADFAKMAGSAFGGIAQEAGRYAISRLHEVPKKSGHQVSEAALVETVRVEFEQYFDVEAKVVKQQFSDIYLWLDQDRTFGGFWGDYSRYNLALARQNIRKHLQGWRDAAMSDWYFFGWQLGPINEAAVQAQIERGLWAGIIVEMVDAAAAEITVSETRGGGDGQAVGGNLDEPLFSETFIDNLKVLNVVTARTFPGLFDQMTRSTKGQGPVAQLLVSDEGVSNAPDIRKLERWAQGLLKEMSGGLAARYLPPAMKRTLLPVGDYVAP